MLGTQRFVLSGEVVLFSEVICIEYVYYSEVCPPSFEVSFIGGFNVTPLYHISCRLW